MPRLLLVSDTNVLIDIEDGNLLHVVFKLPYEFAVPDVLFELELKDHHGHLLQAGLKIKSLTAKSIEKAEILVVKYPKPSQIDRLALTLALQEQCSLLTGDRDLRAAAQYEGIEVHGTLWIIEELLKANLIEHAHAKESIDSMKEKGSRLPWGDVDKLLNTWAPSGTKNE